MSRRKLLQYRSRAAGELLELVEWLVAHDDKSGLSIVLDNHLDVGTFTHTVWSGDGIRALFAVIAEHAPARQLREIVAGAKSCKADIIEIEATRQAAKLLGVDYDELDDFIRARREREQAPTGAEVH